MSEPRLDIDKLPTRLKDLYPGCIIGYFKLVKRVRGSKYDSAMVRKKWRALCFGCNVEYTIPGNYFIRRPNPKLHCGCQQVKTLSAIHNREYRIWYMIRVRTTDERHIAYKNYGGRGIKMFPAWFDWETGFEAFFNYVGSAPSKKHSIDRKDNNKGYEPGNVRWATATEQAQNTRAKQAQREAKQGAQA